MRDDSTFVAHKSQAQRSTRHARRRAAPSRLSGDRSANRTDRAHADLCAREPCERPGYMQVMRAAAQADRQLTAARNAETWMDDEAPTSPARFAASRSRRRPRRTVRQSSSSPSLVGSGSASWLLSARADAHEPTTGPTREEILRIADEFSAALVQSRRESPTKQHKLPALPKTPPPLPSHVVGSALPARLASAASPTRSPVWFSPEKWTAAWSGHENEPRPSWPT